MPVNDDAVDLESQSTLQESHSAVQLESQSTIMTPTPSSSRTFRKRTLPNEDRLEEAYKVMNLAKNKIIAQDECSVYGQYVASELREIKDEHSVIMAKYYINNILIDARLGKYRSGCSTTNQSTVHRDINLGYSTASSNISSEHFDEHIEQIITDMDSSNTQ